MASIWRSEGMTTTKHDVKHKSRIVTDGPPPRARSVDAARRGK